MPVSNLASGPSIGIPQNVNNLTPASTNAHPAVTVSELDDPTAAGASIELIDQDAVQLHAVPFRARRVIVRLEDAAVVFHSTNLRVRTHTSVRRGLIAYVTFGPHAKGTVSGLPVRPGLVLAAEPGAEARFVADAGWESITILLPPQEITLHLTARQRESDFRLPHGVETLQVNDDRGRALFDWGKRLVTVAARAQGWLRRAPGLWVARTAIRRGWDRRPGHRRR
jgi:hypothetical protein